MTADSTYRVNSPHVISEIIEGEAIILNFDSGSYYGLNESGMVIWENLQQGLSEGQILLNMQQRYSDAESQAASDLTELLEVLVSEQLVVPEAVTAPDQARYDGSRTPYVKPALQKFTDLQELLLLDPIHDVDESGWPHQTP